MMEILLKPIITEKMTSVGEKHNRYGFVVSKKANKIQIKDAVEKMYGVSVDRVIPDREIENINGTRKVDVDSIHSRTDQDVVFYRYVVSISDHSDPVVAWDGDRESR